ncbi:hypothetical protein SASPL_116525 [Salvia splendens]|uniref:Uncharacterized protein n=1 Tax=Salvia splendens TaxID=180675 RepID=A0A8X8ZXC1_SALSN|nr:uncharacterized protein LOC121808521 [Salvia splendens]KAG6420011.1 hypothetical protein SASPL_116525 [Salvia splendens]
MFRAVAASSSRKLLFGNGRRFSSAAAAHSMLVNALDSKIKHITQMRPEAPAEFPFKIEHNFGGYVSMTRELAGEEIEVRLVDEKHKDKSVSDSSSVDLKIEIYKADGKSMNFAATASADEIVIQKLTTKDGDNNVVCSQLCIEPESELQKALGEFLHARGIEKSIGGFLYDYTMWNSQKSDQLDVEQLVKLKNVVTNW